MTGAGGKRAGVFGRASLLDRLVDEEPALTRERRPYRAQTEQQARESLRRDLEWLLNTRCPRPEDQIDWADRTALDYGVPDFGLYFSKNPEDWRKIAGIIEKTIQAYEPRLHNPRAESVPAKDLKSIAIFLTGVLRTEAMELQVSFPVELSRKGEGAWAKIG